MPVLAGEGVPEVLLKEPVMTGTTSCPPSTGNSPPGMKVG